VSVGAVYDSNVGSVTAGFGNNACTDRKTSADKITCFSQVANFLTALAPGVFITAAGVRQGGTSQAAPHVAGAVAAMRFTDMVPFKRLHKEVDVGVGVCIRRPSISGAPFTPIAGQTYHPKSQTSIFYPLGLFHVRRDSVVASPSASKPCRRSCRTLNCVRVSSPPKLLLTVAVMLELMASLNPSLITNPPSRYAA
jgi:hypothetical protein